MYPLSSSEIVSVYCDRTDKKRRKRESSSKPLSFTLKKHILFFDTH